MMSDKDLIPDLPRGNLDSYRQKASFDWKALKLHIDGPDIVKAYNDVYNYLQSSQLFQHPQKELSVEDERHLTFLRIKEIHNNNLFSRDEYFLNARKGAASTWALGSYDWSLTARKFLLKEFIQAALILLGTNRHKHFVEALENLEIGGSFCLTEISHGTNTRGLLTEATYDPESQCFILHTPCFEAAKCWAGNLGKTATHCVVFAQLYTSDGVCHGLHGFFVPVREPNTLNPYPGVLIVDMGAKLGLNGIDNGIVMFDKYSIPREYLLNRTGDVTPDGQYVSPIRDPNKRFSSSLGNLSGGRASIIGFGVVFLKSALTIAIRYSAVRRQFGPENEPEMPVLEYPLQQMRLFPYLAALYVLDNFSKNFIEHFIDFQVQMLSGPKSRELTLYGQEIHALSCVGKSISGWMARDAIQEGREACGGHGYLRVAGFGQLRNDNDASLTYEGDNTVILQQTSNWLLSLLTRNQKDIASYPMKSPQFLIKRDSILRERWDASTFSSATCSEEMMRLCLRGLEWTVCWLAMKSLEEAEDLVARGKDKFHVQNHTQLFRATPLALSYGELTMLRWYIDHTEKAPEQSLKNVLYHLGALFGLQCLNSHLSVLIEGALIADPRVVTNMQEATKSLLSKLLPEAVSLVDAVAPPDFILRSALGNADGRVYDHLKLAMFSEPGALARSEKWQEMAYPLVPSRL